MRTTRILRLKELISITFALSALIISATANSETVKLIASDAVDRDELGNAVAIDERFTIVSASMKENGSSKAGAVYIYNDDGEEYQQIKPSGLASNSYFGSSLVLNGDWLFIGASGDDSLANNAGAVYVYRLQTTDPACAGYAEGCWVFSEMLLASDGYSYDAFGKSMAYSDGFLVVGAPNHYRRRKGKVYIFTYTGNQWSESQDIDLPFVNTSSWNNEHFGASVAIDGNTLIVGAPFSDIKGTNAGAVYTFSYNGIDWDNDQILHPDEILGADYFGGAVALSGERFVVGATGRDDEYTRRGAIYIYEKNSNSGHWELSQKLLDDKGNTTDYLGDAVAMESNLIIASAPGDYAGAGSVVFFQKIEGQWEQVGRSTKLDGRYGQAIDIDGFKIAIGGPRSDFAGYNTGEVVVIDFLEMMMETVAKKYNLPAVAAGVLLNGVLAKNTVVGTRKVGVEGVKAEVGDLWSIASNTKSVTALMISKAIALGIPNNNEDLTWTTTLGELYPEYFIGSDSVKQAYESVTLENLLDHTAKMDLAWPCFSRNATVEEFPGLSAYINFVTGVIELVGNCDGEGENEARDESYLRSVLNTPPLKKEKRNSGGNVFLDVYSNTAYIVAAQVLEDWSEMSYEELLEHYIFKKYETEHGWVHSVGADEDVTQPWGHFNSRDYIGLNISLPIRPEANPVLIYSEPAAPGAGLRLTIESWSKILNEQREGLNEDRKDIEAGNLHLENSIYAKNMEAKPGAFDFDLLKCRVEINCIESEFNRVDRYKDNITSAHYAQGWRVYDHPKFGKFNVHGGNMFIAESNQYLFLDGHDIGLIFATNSGTSDLEWEKMLMLSTFTFLSGLNY